MAQSVGCLTLDFSSGHDLAVRGFEPHVGLHTDSAEPAWDSLPLSLYPSPVHAYVFLKPVFKSERSVTLPFT